MSKKHFSDEQVIALKGNPCVESASKLSVSFTEEFKRKAYGQILSGKSMYQIFKDNDIDTDALGPIRIMKFQQHLRMCADRCDGFKNMRNEWHKSDIKKDKVASEQRVKNLENEVAYLRQVVEFLKKIQQADSGAKK